MSFCEFNHFELWEAQYMSLSGHMLQRNVKERKLRVRKLNRF
jgi:hypothetical protein